MACSSSHQFVRGLVGRIPGCFVIHNDLDSTRFGRGLNPARLFHIHGKRFFHHHVDVVRRAQFDDAAMIERGRERSYGIDVCLREQRVQAVIEKIGRQIELLREARRHGGVRFDDAYDLNFRMISGQRKESKCVIVDQSENGKTNRRFRILRSDRVQRENETEKKKEFFHWWSAE